MLTMLTLMDKILSITIIILIGLFVIFFNLHNFYINKKIDVATKPTIQYTHPIGPTQETPYQLKSKMIGVNVGQ